jgi:hypothetical protein
MQYRLLLICFLPFYFLAQKNGARIANILKVKPREIVKFELKNRPNQLFLETNFNNANFKNPKDLNQAKGKTILKIELAYTTYHKSETFDQHSLNRKRMEMLFQVAPNCAQAAAVEWVLWAQTGCTSPEMGADFFHGFVITYRDEQDSTLTSIESDFLRKVKNGDLKSYTYDTYLKKEKAKVEAAEERDPVIVLPKFAQGEKARIDYFSKALSYPSGAKAESVPVQFYIDKEGKISKVVFPERTSNKIYKDEIKDFIDNMPPWKPGTLDGKPTECMVQFTVDFMARGSVVPSPLEIYATEVPPKLKAKLPEFNYQALKPTPISNQVTKALDKMDWKNTVMVCDVTGSMAPYSAEVLEFLKVKFTSKTDPPAHYVFFNDEYACARKIKSKLPEKPKVGVYGFTVNTIDSLTEAMISVMERGGSNCDMEENDLEAILLTTQMYPECSKIVLIADNFATPKDMALLPKVTVPVHVVVCGGMILNESYLTIAHRTKGTVTFRGKPYENIAACAEKGTVVIERITYMLLNGVFVRQH